MDKPTQLSRTVDYSTDVDIERHCPYSDLDYYKKLWRQFENGKGIRGWV